MRTIVSSGWDPIELLPKRRRLNPLVRKFATHIQNATNIGPRIYKGARDVVNDQEGNSLPETCDHPKYLNAKIYQAGLGPGDLPDVSKIGSSTTWLTDPWQIYIFTEIVPLIVGVLVFTFFLVVSVVLIYGLIRHCYLDHVLPTIFFTLKPLRKGKLKIVYLQYPDSVALSHRGYFKWNSYRHCYRRHSECQLHHKHRNHRGIVNHGKSNDKLRTLRMLKQESIRRNKRKSEDLKLKPAAAVSRLAIHPKVTHELAVKASKQAPKGPEIKSSAGLKADTAIHYQQNFSTGETMLSVDDVKLDLSRTQTPLKLFKRKRLQSLKTKLLSKKNLESIQKQTQVEIISETKAGSGTPISHTRNKKRKSLKPEDTPQEKVETNKVDKATPREAKGKSSKRKETLTTNAKLVKPQKKIFKKRDSINKPPGPQTFPSKTKRN